mmetsp:Transcript_7946/g.18400  ORF Transcript_7946/g.18400 Transcript_7946/m.18400 type:complete len:196 (-) Transcript_7946:273-860(-)
MEEWQFGYQNYQDADEIIPCPSSSKGVATLESFVVTPTNDYEAVMNAVAKVGPIAINVASHPWQHYESGIFSPPPSTTGTVNVNHVVVLMGYGTDSETGQDYWLVRNSWGPQWGEQGYIRLKRQDPTKMENPNDDCGVDVTPFEGNACAIDEHGNPIDPPATKVCGTSAAYYVGVFPMGVRLLQKKNFVCAPPSP